MADLLKNVQKKVERRDELGFWGIRPQEIGQLPVASGPVYITNRSSYP